MMITTDMILSRHSCTGEQPAQLGQEDDAPEIVVEDEGMNGGDGAKDGEGDNGGEGLML